MTLSEVFMGSKQTGEQAFQLILRRFDDVEARLVRQDVVLDKVEKQTTITNGRVTMLEKINSDRLKASADAVTTRHWWIETIVKLAPWVSILVTLYLAIKLT